MNTSMIDWDKLSEPPLMSYHEAKVVSDFQSELYLGFISENTFISALNIVFDMMTLEEE